MATLTSGTLRTIAHYLRALVVTGIGMLTIASESRGLGRHAHLEQCFPLRTDPRGLSDNIKRDHLTSIALSPAHGINRGFSFGIRPSVCYAGPLRLERSHSSHLVSWPGYTPPVRVQ